MKTEAVQPDKGGYWQVVEKRIDFLEGAQFAACLFHCVSKKRPPIENQNNQNSIRTGSFLLSVCCSFFVVSTFPSVACFRLPSAFPGTDVESGKVFG